MLKKKIDKDESYDTTIKPSKRRRINPRKEDTNIKTLTANEFNNILQQNNLANKNKTSRTSNSRNSMDNDDYKEKSSKSNQTKKNLSTTYSDTKSERIKYKDNNNKGFIKSIVKEKEEEEKITNNSNVVDDDLIRTSKTLTKSVSSNSESCSPISKGLEQIVRKRIVL